MNEEILFEFWLDDGRLILTDHEANEHDCSDWLEAAGYTIVPIEEYEGLKQRNKR